MLRFLGFYPIAILLAVTVVTFITKHLPVATPPRQDSTPAQMAFAGPAPRGGSAQYAITPDSRGHYVTPVDIEGYALRMLVDTGATFVSLTNEDAAALGIRPVPSDFTLRMQTANGRALAAPTRIPSLRLGPIEVRDVEAIVMARGASNASLLGMSFLGKLGRFGVSDGQMRLEQ